MPPPCPVPGDSGGGVVVSAGELAVRKLFVNRRVSLHTLTTLRGEVVRSGSGTQQSAVARFDLVDADGRTMSLYPHAVTDGRRDETGSLVEGVVRELRGDTWSHLRPVA